MRKGPPKISPPEIYVQNAQRKFRVDVASLQQFAQRALALCLRVRSGPELKRLPREVFVLLISDRRMAGLHRQFLNQTGPTDVITFQHGEIFVSIPTAQRQARQLGTSLLREIQLYIVHGLLHLRGFDDQSESDARKMHALQSKIVVAALRLLTGEA
ncbi:MAG: putative metal-dependent hydrolase [Verrucomicrobiales bacterium]|nr:putative metal-dependent hydrolase [Verrucomicrobiales bacterium]